MEGKRQNWTKGKDSTSLPLPLPFVENTSPHFKQFLNFLGETIELKGWKGYRAGLDVSGCKEKKGGRGGGRSIELE